MKESGRERNSEWGRVRYRGRASERIPNVTTPETMTDNNTVILVQTGGISMISHPFTSQDS